MPLVSIIIPTYNSAKFINETLDSVWRQTYTNYEVIVVDDGSTDNTVDILKPWQDKITLIKKTNGGISSARNAGLAISKGSLIAHLDGDDIWLPTKLAKQVEFLQHHPHISIVFSHAQNFLDPTFKPNTPSMNNFSIMPAHFTSNCLVKREVFAQIGRYNETVILGEFAEWYSRALNANIGIGCVPSLLILRRIHGNNIGIKEKHRLPDYLHILKKKIDAQKLTAPTLN